MGEVYYIVLLNGPPALYSYETFHSFGSSIPLILKYHHRILNFNFLRAQIFKSFHTDSTLFLPFTIFYHFK